MCLLRSYGLIRHIVSQMLGMVFIWIINSRSRILLNRILQISSSGPYVVLYSGHDHTIEHLSTALGLQNDPLLLRYAARIVFEVYHNTSETQGGASGLYFRLLTNGKDVTKQVSFCKKSVTLSSKITLCKIENIIRFLHDDYFTIFNVTNFKDACYQKLTPPRT